MRKIIFTKQGFADLIEEKHRLEEIRVATVKDLQKAREMGDLSENGFYKATKSRLGQIDHRLFEIDILTKRAHISEKQSSNFISIGSEVELELNGQTIKYFIVGDTEANLTENKISSHSPLGSALINKKVGDLAKVKLPQYSAIYKILAIK